MPFEFSTRSVVANAIKRLKARSALSDVEDRLGTELVFDIYRQSDEQNRKVIHKAVRNWTLLLDEVIYIYSCFHIMLLDDVFERKGNVPAEQRVYALLLGAIVSQMLSVRALVLLGHEISVKNSARLLSEYLDLFQYLLLDESLCEEFQKAQSLDDSNRFWHEHIARRKIRRKLARIRKEIWPKRAAWIENIEGWREQEGKLLSASAHPSFIASFMAISGGGYVKKAGTGAFGNIDTTSVRTISFCFFIAAEVLEVMYGRRLTEYVERREQIEHFISVAEKSVDFAESLWLYALANQHKSALSTAPVTRGTNTSQGT